MILLEEAVHKVKVEFNNKVRELNGGQGALDGEGRGPLRMRAGGPSLLLEEETHKVRAGWLDDVAGPW